MSKCEEDKYIWISEQYVQEIEQKAKESEYFRGRVDGMEYVIDTLENAFKRSDDE